jgi:hypothetical protein
MDELIGGVRFVNFTRIGYSVQDAIDAIKADIATLPKGTTVNLVGISMAAQPMGEVFKEYLDSDVKVRLVGINPCPGGKVLQAPVLRAFT